MKNKIINGSNNRLFDSRERKLILLFIIIALSSGWIGILVDRLIPEQLGEETLGMGIWLVLPFFSGLIIRLVAGDWKNFGVKIKLGKNIKWYALAILIFPIITLIFTLLAWLLGFAEINSFPTDVFLSTMVKMFLALFIKNIFEDFAWQGFLTPMLVKIKLLDWKIYLIVGLVWAFWHAPYYLYFLPDTFYSSDISRILDTFVFSPIVITIWAVVFVELTRITESVWPAVLMHTVEDLVPNFLIFESQVITFSGLGDLLFNPLKGVLPLIVFLIVGLYLRKYRINKEAN